MADEADVGTRQAEAVGELLPRSTAEARKDLLAASGLFLFAFALYLLPAVLSRPLSETPELRIAVVARQMVRTGDYVVPKMYDEPRLNKPPLPYWLAAGSASLLSGQDGPTVRVMTRATELPTAALSAATLFLVVLYGSTIFGRAAGVSAGLVLGLSILVVSFAQQGYGDPVLMFFMTGVYCSAAWISANPRPGFASALGMGVPLGLAILTKGHIPVVLLLVVLAAQAAIYRRFNARKVLLVAVGLAIAAAIAAPWFFMVEERLPGAMQTMITELKAGAGMEATAHAQDDRWIYYFYQMLGGLLPWTPLVLMALAVYALRNRKQDEDGVSGTDVNIAAQTCFFTTAFVTGFVVFYFASKQQPYYLLPLFPPLALALGRLLGRFSLPGGVNEEKLAWTQVWVGVIFGAGLASMPLWSAGIHSTSRTATDFFQQLSGPIGFAITIPCGVAAFAMHLYCARQWAEGRPAAAVVSLSIAAYVLIAVATVLNVPRERRNLAMLQQAPEVKKQIDAVGSGARVYAYGVGEPIAMFYLDRPVFSLAEMAAEPEGKTGPDAPERVLLLKPADAPKLAKAYGIDLGDAAVESKEYYLVVPLSREKDWPAEVAKHKKN